MTLRPIFGRKVKGETLKNLVEALGGDPESHLHRENGWIDSELTGRASIRPIDKGFDVELVINVQDVHVKYSKGKEIGRIYRTSHCAILNGIIPYSQKLETETQVSY